MLSEKTQNVYSSDHIFELSKDFMEVFNVLNERFIAHSSGLFNKLKAVFCCFVNLPSDRSCYQKWSLSSEPIQRCIIDRSSNE